MKVKMSNGEHEVEYAVETIKLKRLSTVSTKIFIVKRTSAVTV